MEKSHVLKEPRHASYRAHRRQFWLQIMLPIVLGALLILVVPLALWLTRMGGAGDVGRWAAISTMWLLIPVMIAFLLLFVVVLAAIYLFAVVNTKLPTYSLRAQRFIDSAALGTQRAAWMVRKPVLAVRALSSAARAQFRRLRERV